MCRPHMGELTPLLLFSQIDWRSPDLDTFWLKVPRGALKSPLNSCSARRRAMSRGDDATRRGSRRASWFIFGRSSCSYRPGAPGRGIGEGRSTCQQPPGRWCQLSAQRLARLNHLVLIRHEYADVRAKPAPHRQAKNHTRVPFSAGWSDGNTEVTMRTAQAMIPLIEAAR